MNGLDISGYLSKHPLTKLSFKGVYARNEMPSPAPGLYIFNTDRMEDPGSHWVLAFIKNKKCFYFDSYGMPPLYKEFYDFFKGDFHYNKQQLQHEKSSVCGLYVCYVGAQLCAGHSLQQIRKKFTKNYRLNDKFIVTLFKKHFCAYKPSRSGMSCHSLCNHAV